ncbi:MAG: hypothetical protein A2Z16_16355 [Chloroflexi bacterium RBG_16_54_18]|nr:MAG: hypothetical protein A2Z16_16355 [Chloroflexi bacterium RBG_16_54_18]
MKSISFLALMFSMLSLVFFILLVFLRIPFPPFPLISYQDVFDILTPLVLIPIYWLLFRCSSSRSDLASESIFMILASLWIQGQGMHLAANSINNLISGLADKQLIDKFPIDVVRLTYFFDEILSHYLWHLGVVGLAVLLIYREWRYPAGQKTVWWAAIAGGLLYGFTLFTIFLEGQTIIIGIPFVCLIVLFSLIWSLNHLGQKPVLAFFFVSCLVAALFFAVWGLYWGGFPQFSDVGLI